MLTRPRFREAVVPTSALKADDLVLAPEPYRGVVLRVDHLGKDSQMQMVTAVGILWPLNQVGRHHIVVTARAHDTWLVRYRNT